MLPFDVLAPDLNLDQSWFIEASAGTGKTFAIAHLVARLVRERQVPVERIAVMTFTRAAARELRQRIAAVLPQADVEAAPIGTIHAICLRYLDETAGEALKGVERRLEAIESVLRRGAGLHPAQLRRLVAGREEQLVEQLLRASSKPVVKALPEVLPELDAELLRDQLERYRGIYRRDGSLHEGVQKALETAQPSWDWALGDGFELLKRFDPSQLRSGQEGTHPAVDQWREAVLPRMDPHNVKKIVQEQVWSQMEQSHQEEGWLDPDQIIEAALQVRPKDIDVLIVDEFQDTDPRQWQMIQNWAPPRLVLVGDPKQSIYAFRNADLYTYLAARDSFALHERATLRVNYRSAPPLVHGINQLFAGSQLFRLPKLGQTLQVEEVAAGAQLEPIQDGAPAIIWMEAQSSEQLHQWLCDELLRLQSECGSCAILVRDKYQGAAVAAALKQRGIPHQAASGDEALISLKALLDAVSQPQSAGRLRKFLTSPLMALPLEQMRGLEMAEELQRLRRVWEEQGAVALLHQALYSRWTGMVSWKERLLEQPRLLSDLERSMELLARRPMEPDSWQLQWPFFEAQWDQLDESIEADSVTITTIHKSKGLQWDLVFALGVEPHRRDDPDDAEAAAERMRQLYVAATRPRRRLYLPLNALPRPVDGLYQVNCVPEGQTRWSQPQQLDSINLQTPPSVPSPKLLSFTALKGRAPQIGGVRGGRQLGSRFHELVHRRLERRDQLPVEEPMQSWLHNALHTPLPGLGCIWDLPRESIWSEMEFGLLEEGNILRGAMDLVVRHRGRWTLIDWKTNQLESYEAAGLHAAMEAGRYLDQARLYGRALQRWIDQVAPGERLTELMYVFVRGPGVYHVGA